MKLIDYLRLNPMCFDNSTDKVDFDASDYIEGATCFDVSEVADQLVESVTEVPGQGNAVLYTPKGREVVKLVPMPGDENKRTIDYSQFIGIIPPFTDCFFEYPEHNYVSHGEMGPFRILGRGIHLWSASPDWIALKIPDAQERGIKFVMQATVFTDTGTHGNHIVARETVAYIATGADGNVIACNIEALLPDGTDRSLPTNQPQFSPIMVMLVALMMLNCSMVKRTLTEPPPKTRQQRRYEERHPQRATPPPVRFYTLEIDLDKTGTGASGAGKKSAWEQAWHKVRGHLRHYKSGKVVPVRPYSKGNPFKGVVFKDYKLKGGTAA